MAITTLSFLAGLAGGACLTRWMSTQRRPPAIHALQNDAVENDVEETPATQNSQQSDSHIIIQGVLPSDRVELLSTLSYEIRTPITSILGYLDLLEEENWGRPNSLELISIVKRNSQHLLEIINNLRDLARLGTGHIETEVEKFSTGKFFRDLEAWARVRDPQQKQHRMVLNVSPSMPTDLKGDAKSLQHIIHQLIKSCWRDRQASSFRVYAFTATTNDGRQMLHFKMTDNGKPLPLEQVQKFFETHRVDAQGTLGPVLYGSLGLGLNLSKMLIESIGGQFDIIPQPDVGNCYELIVPVEIVEAPAPVKVIDMVVGEKAVSQSGAHVFKFDPAKTDSNSGLSGRHVIASGVIKVLLVEDGLDNQRLIRHVLKKVGMEVEIAEHGAIGLEKAMNAWKADNPFDVILMDMHMPVMDGYEATRKLREDGYKGVIIALTAHALKQDREHCLSVGCDDYTTKPINRAELVNLVRGRVRVEPKADALTSSDESSLQFTDK